MTSFYLSRTAPPPRDSSIMMPTEVNSLFVRQINTPKDWHWRTPYSHGDMVVPGVIMHGLGVQEHRRRAHDPEMIDWGEGIHGIHEAVISSQYPSAHPRAPPLLNAAEANGDPRTPELWRPSLERWRPTVLNNAPVIRGYGPPHHDPWPGRPAAGPVSFPIDPTVYERKAKELTADVRSFHGPYRAEMTQMGATAGRPFMHLGM